MNYKVDRIKRDFVLGDIKQQPSLWLENG